MQNILIIMVCLWQVIELATGVVFAAEAPVIYAVWARPQAGRTSTLHYAAQRNQQWTEPIELPLNKGLHITPVIAVDREDTIWVVWIERTAEENILRYAKIKQQKTAIGRVHSRGNEQSYAPTILIDHQDRPWIAWSGVTDQLADIYTSRWNGNGWDKPVLVHPINQTPDITPILGEAEGKKIWVAWIGMNKEQERYVRYHALQQQDGRWLVLLDKTASAEETKEFIRQRTGQDMSFPKQAGAWRTGAFFVGLDYEIQAISERFAAFKHKGEQNEQDN
ncbi:MAG: hypothetical protein D3923_05250 [Candidatus Electrothrix sp. AR3]|nr:hypothetical protein [Candidatus Electrothrix sp. AR3]